MNPRERVFFACPACDHLIREVVPVLWKASLGDYVQDEVPVRLAAVMERRMVACPHCGERFMVTTDPPLPEHVALRLVRSEE